MTAENLSRNLAILTEHGVRTEGRNITITDRGKLEAFAIPNGLIDG
jgi:CRP/FNR family transcriptional activator FtrB